MEGSEDIHTEATPWDFYSVLDPAVAPRALFYFFLQDSLIILVVFFASHCCDASF